MKSVATPVSVRRAFLVVTGALLAVRLLLTPSYARAAALQLMGPVHDHFFPELLRHPALLLIGFFVPLAGELMVLLHPTPRDMKRTAVLEVGGAALLLLHQASYFYATWVVGFWVGLFMVWLAWSAVGHDSRAEATGPFLAQLITGFVFLGGAVGKWTAGYWSGIVFEDLFFERPGYSPLAQLRLWLSEPVVHWVAVWFSRGTVVFETLMVLVVLLPARTASTISVLAATGLWVVSPDLFEVAWPLMGLAIAGRLLASSSTPEPRADGSGAASRR